MAASNPAGPVTTRYPVEPAVPGRWRPAPPNATYNPEWTPARRRLFAKWIPVIDGLPEDDEVILRMQDRAWEGDRLMDDVVGMFKRLPLTQGRTLFEQALERGIDTVTDPPPELIALFAQLDRVPDWIDLAQVERGAVVAANITPAGKAAGMFLNTIATVQGGAVGEAVGATGRMQRDVVHRARESATFWYHLPSPGGLGRFGTGFKNAVRVRLMHSQVRLMLMRRWGDAWIAENGIPIPNSAIVAGVPTFGIANLMYDMTFGRIHSRQDMEDIHIFWAYIGYILGGDEAILPRTPEEGIKILNYALSVMPPPSQYADALNAVSNLLLNSMMNSVRFPVFDAALKPYLLQALNGFYFHVGGDFLARRITETAEPTFVGRLVPVVIKGMVLASNVERFLPGRQRRWEAQRADGDPFWGALVEQFDKLAADQQDGRRPNYRGHDTTQAEEMGEPMARA